MEKYSLCDIDLQKNQVKNAVIHALSSPPSSPVAGQVYFDTTRNQLGRYDGTNWRYLLPKITDSESSPHTSVETTATSIEAYGSLHAGRYGLADSNGVNAFQVGNGIDSQNLSNIHELTWNGTSWTKQDVSCGGTASNPTKLLSRSMQIGAEPMTEAQLQTLINNSGLIPGCYYATLEV